MPTQSYTYNATDDDLASFNASFTSRHGDGSGDPEEDFLACLRLVACSRSGGEFLDIGAGFGRIIDIIHPYAGHVVALEPDAERCRSCRDGFKNRVNVEIHQAVTSEYRATCSNIRFDLITLSMVQQHVSTRESSQTLDDVRTLLAPHGLAVIATTHFFEERFLYSGRAVPVSMGEFDQYARDAAGQKWGIPVRMFSKQSFQADIRRASLDIIFWKQFFYARPERAESVAVLYGVTADDIRDVGLSQFAVVRAA